MSLSCLKPFGWFPMWSRLKLAHKAQDDLNTTFLSSAVLSHSLGSRHTAFSLYKKPNLLPPASRPLHIPASWNVFLLLFTLCHFLTKPFFILQKIPALFGLSYPQHILVGCWTQIIVIHIGWIISLSDYKLHEARDLSTLLTIVFPVTSTDLPKTGCSIIKRISRVQCKDDMCNVYMNKEWYLHIQVIRKYLIMDHIFNRAQSYIIQFQWFFFKNYKISVET